MRAEMWLPLWSRPASFAEVAHIFGEGRVQFSGPRRRAVHTGFDFARAVAELGVDRGIDAFQRYGFLERNGQANLATPLGRFEVRERPRARLIHEFDRWFDALRRATSDAKRTPPRFIRALSHVEEASFQVCASGQPADLQATLVALGAAEAELAQSPRFREEHALRPLISLSERWASECDDQSAEFELAVALASMVGEGKRGSFRTHLEPVAVTGAQVTWTGDDAGVVWGTGALTENLAAVLQRRSIEGRTAGASHPALASRR
jgi:CRISPR-associated protein Csx17